MRHHLSCTNIFSAVQTFKSATAISNSRISRLRTNLQSAKSDFERAIAVTQPVLLPRNFYVNSLSFSLLLPFSESSSFKFQSFPVYRKCRNTSLRFKAKKNVNLKKLKFFQSFTTEKGDDILFKQGEDDCSRNVILLDQQNRGATKASNTDPNSCSASVYPTAISFNQSVVDMSPAKKMMSMPILTAGVHRLDPSEAARKSAHPSLSFFDPIQREKEFVTSEGQLSLAKELAGAQCRIENGVQTVMIKLPEDTTFYGTGEVSGNLERTGRRIFTWNTDAWGYSRTTTSLYQSHPWVLAILPDGSSLGVLADTTRRCEIDLRKAGTIKFVAAAHFPLITFGPFGTPQEVLMTLSNAIGKMEMPPFWALGFHQCRFSYEPASRVVQVASTFREKKLPCDVIWMDIDYMDGFRCFTFDPVKFPDPKALSEELHQLNFKAVWMIDPGIKEEAGYSVYDEGNKADVWVLKSNKQPYTGTVWPGSCRFPDYTMEKTRKWWSKLIKEFAFKGVDGIWNDMNEPAVFDAVTKTMPETNIHRGDEDLGGTQSHFHYHNVYGMLMTRSTWEGIKIAKPDKRPFVLTRAGYIGSHRYAATWTGDNLATWEHLHFSIPMALNLGLSGQPFCGPDIGGFGGDSTPRLFARWMGIGALLPFSRAHSETGTRDHEPWSFGPECETVSRLALERRYRLLPHIYSLFYFSHTKGLPVVAPLFFADPRDPRLRRVENAFLLGPLLVACSTEKEKDPSSNVILPKGIWRQFQFKDPHPDLPLLYLQGGGIVPTGPVVQNVEEFFPEQTITLLVALNDLGHAEGFLFEDDGDGYGYRNGDFLLTQYKATKDGEFVVIDIENVKGNRARPNRNLHVRLLVGDDIEVEGEGVDGVPIRLKFPTREEMEILELEAKNRAKQLTFTARKLEADVEQDKSKKGLGTSHEPIDFNGKVWNLKIAPFSGGRIVSMVHIPSGKEWLESRVDLGGYEEYSGTEYRSPGCSEPYRILEREVTQMEGEDSVQMEGDIGGGLSMCRTISVPRDKCEQIQIKSSIVAKTVGAGAGGFSRVVCLRVHPSFKIPNPFQTVVRFKTIDGIKKELNPEFGEAILKGRDQPDGEWALVDKETGWTLVNYFKPEEVEFCFLHWGGGFCNLELWSQERPVSKDSPLTIEHYYEAKWEGENRVP